MILNLKVGFTRPKGSEPKGVLDVIQTVEYYMPKMSASIAKAIDGGAKLLYVEYNDLGSLTKDNFILCGMIVQYARIKGVELFFTDDYETAKEISRDGENPFEKED